MTQKLPCRLPRQFVAFFRTQLARQCSLNLRICSPVSTFITIRCDPEAYGSAIANFGMLPCSISTRPISYITLSVGGSRTSTIQP
jgi:hypothetical protein